MREHKLIITDVNSSDIFYSPTDQHISYGKKPNILYYCIEFKFDNSQYTPRFSKNMVQFIISEYNKSKRLPNVIVNNINGKTTFILKRN